MVDGHFALARLEGHGGDFGLERARFNGLLGPRHAGDGKGILLLAGELVFGGAVFAKGAHAAARFVSVFQTVKHHVVKHLVVAHAVAAPAFFQQIGGVGHALHAARNHDLAAAGHDLVVGQDGGFHARAAHFGQGDGTGALRQAAFETGLAGGGLALAGHQAVAKQHFFDFFWGDASPRDGGLDRSAAQVVRGQVGKTALEGTHGGAHGADDDDGVLLVGHVVFSWV